jgi:hypothetical protein
MSCSGLSGQCSGRSLGSLAPSGRRGNTSACRNFRTRRDSRREHEEEEEVAVSCSSRTRRRRSGDIMCTELIVNE